MRNAFTLAEILEGVPVNSKLTAEAARLPVTGLDYDSRRVEKGFLFFAFAGANTDGRRFAAQALERGATAVVSQLPPPPDFPGLWIEVPHGRRALALAARRFHDDSSRRLAVTGITGTNGKTTTSHLVDAILRSAGYTTALIGTIEYRLAGETFTAANTTPESLDLYRIFRQLEQQGGRHVTMEVSSHALALGRVHGVHFHTAAFTNLTRDHLDFHGTMEDYFASKRQLFSGQDAPPPAFAVLNRDDAMGSRIQPPPATKTLSYGLEESAEIQAVSIESTFSGLRFTVRHQGRSYPVSSPLVGRMNVYNILAAFGIGLTLGLEPGQLVEGIAGCGQVPGRFERVEEGQPFLVVVDYAHTDDALRNLLKVARTLTRGRVLTVFGCGGDRDRSKRPLMGEAAARGSDFVAITSDNPRSEDPLMIINDALVGLRRHDVAHIVELDRRTAIRRTLQEADPGDVVVIAGKGHETYQVVGGRTIPFDDRQVARDILRSYGYGRERQ